MLRVKEAIGEQKPEYCVQCGKCTSVCPVSRFLDFNPRKIIAMVDLDMVGELTKSSTIWNCAECLKCSGTCPRTVSPYDTIQALRAIAVEEGEPYPEGLGRLQESVIEIGFIQRPQVIRTLARERLSRQSLNLPHLQSPIRMQNVREALKRLIGSGE